MVVAVPDALCNLRLPIGVVSRGKERHRTPSQLYTHLLSLIVPCIPFFFFPPLPLLLLLSFTIDHSSPELSYPFPDTATY